MFIGLIKVTKTCVTYCGKGANLAEMTAIGLPVPQGFTITTEACNDYYEKDGQVSSLVLDQIDQALLELEKVQGKVLGSDDNPLLVSVRSGAVFPCLA